jgi:hypothetical protein
MASERKERMTGRGLCPVFIVLLNPEPVGGFL